MLLLIRQLSPDGTVEQSFDFEEVILGRSTECTVELPGLAVALHHARLTVRPDGALRLESLCAAGVELNGAPGVQTADLHAGDAVRIGGHRLRLVRAGDEPILEVELTGAFPASRSAALTTLAEAGWRIRTPALLLALVVLVAGLALPLAMRLWQPPRAVAAVLPTEQFWSPGLLTNAHRHLGAKCDSCHQTPFVSVENRACLGCHRGIAQHSDNPAILAVAGIKGANCTDCHREHRDDPGVVPMHAGVCTGCHAAPGFNQFADLRAAHDFGSAHPEFRPTITIAGKDARVSQSENPRDDSGLRFPHDLHLKEGLRGPTGKEQLVCADCHRREPAAAAFEPISFETHCQRCHQLDVERGALRLPHGDDALAWAALKSYAAAHPVGAFTPEQPGDLLRRRAGMPARRPAPVTAAEVLDEVFETRVCGRCHETVRAAGKPIATRRLALRDSFFPHAHFTHEAHKWQTCIDCHAGQESAEAQDVLLPDITSCRRCHGGADSRQQIASTCIDCHEFHEARTLQFGTQPGERN